GAGPPASGRGPVRRRDRRPGDLHLTYGRGPAAYGWGPAWSAGSGTTNLPASITTTRRRSGPGIPSACGTYGSVRSAGTSSRGTHATSSVEPLVSTRSSPSSTTTG